VTTEAVGNQTFCPEGHRCRPARGMSCMVRAGYFWCARCITWEHGSSVAGGPIRGMYYPPSKVTSLGADSRD
jgi:hypothetical protein